MGLWQQAGETCAPYPLPLAVGDQILADLDCNVMQAAARRVPERYSPVSDDGDNVYAHAVGKGDDKRNIVVLIL